MPTVDTFSPLRTQIAGIEIEQLARQFGTPTYVYDARQDRRADRRPAGLRSRFATPKRPARTWRSSTWCGGTACWSMRSARGEIRRAMAAGYPAAGDPPPIVYTADIFDREALDLVVEHGIHVNCGSPDMIDQLGARRPGREITLRLNPGLRPRSQPKDQHRRRAIEARHLAHELADCLRRADHHGLGVTGLHMHIGSGTDLEHLAQVCGALEKAALRSRAARSRRSAPAAGCPFPIARAKATSISTPTSSCGTRRASGWKTRSATSCDWKSNRVDTWSPRAVIWSRRFAPIKQMGGNTFYLLDAGFNNLARPILYGAYHPMSIVPRGPGGATRPLRDVVVGGPLVRIGRHLHAGGRRLRRARAIAARGRGGRVPGHRVRRGLRLRDGLELQQQAAGGRSADRRRQAASGPPPADVRRSRGRRIDPPT